MFKTPMTGMMCIKNDDTKGQGSSDSMDGEFPKNDGHAS
jgi:hypothetical protein